MAISSNLTLPADSAAASHMVFDNRSIELSSGPSTGVLIVNADDWGRNVETTDRILECVRRGTVSSASAMVFMEDSERAAAIARDRTVEVGLHFNFTSSFSAPTAPGRLAEHHQRVARYLLRNRLSQVIYHPGLASSFKYVVAAQLEEFSRLYGAEPARIDGHHHMHLCANVLLGGLLPSGTIARRNFSFQPGDKSALNRLYRAISDRILAQRHRLTDFFFSLPPFDPPERVQAIFRIARQSVVELETHPVNPEEYRFLTWGEIFAQAADTQIATGFLGFVRPASL